MPDLTPDLDAIRERRRLLWPDGPWAIWTDLTDGGNIHVGNAEGVIPEGQMATPEGAEPQAIAQVYTPELAEFIAAAPSDVAALMAWGEHLAAEVERQARMIRDLRRTMRTYDATLADARSETPGGGEGGE